MKKRALEALPVSGKRVLVRADFNVPLNDRGAITDDTRIRETLPTLQWLLEKGAALVLCSHLGRPKGKPNSKYSLHPVAKRLEELLRRPVRLASDCVGPEVEALARTLKPRDILLLENLRFHPEEETNNPAFAKRLAGLANLFVQDAFGAVHRAHASTVGIPALLPSAAGLLLEKELRFLGKVLEAPPHPFVAILGGAKVSDKIPVIENLLSKVDALVMGGGMAYTFLKTKRIEVGNSLVENDQAETAQRILAEMESRKKTFLLPVDHVIAKKVEAGAPFETTALPDIPAGWIGVDIGPKTIEKIAGVLKRARTVFWNGPLGVFEIPAFATGTLEVARRLAEATRQGTTTIVGGGDSAAAVRLAGVATQVSHISTGGGASLEFLEGKELPGIAALPDA